MFLLTLEDITLKGAGEIKLKFLTYIVLFKILVCLIGWVFMCNLFINSYRKFFFPFYSVSFAFRAFLCEGLFYPVTDNNHQKKKNQYTECQSTL